MFSRHERLRADRLLEHVVLVHLDTARIDEREFAPVPISLVIGTIARYATHLMDDGFIVLCNAIDQR